MDQNEAQSSQSNSTKKDVTKTKNGQEITYPDSMTLHIPGPSHDFEPLKKKNLCGIACFSPAFLQRFATPKWFLTSLCFFVLIQSMMVSGITSSVITTIEERYGLRSAESGLVVSSFDIGSLIVVVFISYFGGQGHRSRWVGIGAVVVAIGAVLFALPQFISDRYKPPTTSSVISDDNLCVENRTNSTSDILCEAQEANSLFLLLFVVSNMIIGIGSTPIYTLGTTFMYDNVHKDDASLYISLIYAIGAVGPAAGYLLGGLFLTFYIDIGNNISTDDTFLGAWWLGYLVCATLILLSSIFLLMFPRQLRMPIRDEPLETPISTPMGDPMTPVTVTTETETTVTSLDTSVISFGKNFKEMPRAFMSLLSNPIYLCVTCSATLEFSIVTAFLTFVPKYLQSHFNVDTVNSSVLTGAVLVPSAGTGILLGGYIVKRLKLNMTGCAQTALLSNLLSMLLFISVFLIACDSTLVVGVNSFPKDPTTDSVMTGLMSICNSDCSCLSSTYNPVCVEGMTFYNPCYAGCSNNLSESTYSSCSCVSAINATGSIATIGECERDCTSTFIPFLFCLFLVTMATVCAHTPSLMVTYRCVKSDERPFAAGLQFVFFRTLAYIPAPIYFGVAIDQACLLWNGVTDQCQNNTGSCLVYDADRFRYIFFGLAFALKLLACSFVFLSWILCRREHSQHTHTTRWRRLRRKKQLSKIKNKKNNNEIPTINVVPSNTDKNKQKTNRKDEETQVKEESTTSNKAKEIDLSDSVTSSSESSVSSSGSQKSLIAKKNCLKLNLISSNIPEQSDKPEQNDAKL